MKKRIARVVGVILFFSLLACEELVVQPSPVPNQEANQEGTKYKIKEGEHDSNPIPSIGNVESLKFKAKFDSTAVYTTVKNSNQGDINKLYGLSDCNSLHHVNSARFGWRWYNERLEILAYTYTNSIREYKLLGSASLNVYHHYEIVFDENKYIFKLDDVTVELPRECNGIARGYKLFPYFGGDETAPHDIAIWIMDSL